MTAIQIKLKRPLFDLFQRCELKCRASCCGWNAFDFSKHWLQRWCEFRDADAIAAARSEIASIRDETSDREPDTVVDLHQFFKPFVRSLAEHLGMIDAELAVHSKRTSG